MLKKTAVFFLFLASILLLQAADDDLIMLSDASTPRVSYQLQRKGNALLLTIEAEGFEPSGKDVSINAGLNADKRVLLASKDAKVSNLKNTARFLFTIPAADLVLNADGWKKLRLAFAVEWAGGFGGQARLKARFLHEKTAAPHAGLASDVLAWKAVDLNEYEKESADRRLQIRIDYEQPMDGKATIVIEDSQGKRIRNLLSGQFKSKGKQSITWDGLDDGGTIVAPGKYRWRGIFHPGLQPNFVMEFVNAPGSNHGTLHAATTNGTRIFLGSPVSEGGHQVVVLEKDGTFVKGFNAPNGHGLGRIQLAADDRYIYAAYDGNSWGTKIDRSKENWTSDMNINLVRFEIETGQTADFSKTNRTPLLFSYQVGPGSPKARPEEKALRGLVLLGGRLYCAINYDNIVLDIDPVTGESKRSFPLKEPLALATDGTSLFAIAEGNQLVKVDTAGGTTQKIAALSGKPNGLALGPDGRFYVSDNEKHVIHVLDAKGKEVALIGKPGGISPGPYDPLRFQNPEGLAVLDGLLWVTENGRWEPKRFGAFDVKTGQMAHEYFGPTNYGAQGAGFDYQDQTRWIGQGTMFQLDMAKGSAKPLFILGGETGRSHKFWKQDGRTFIITSGKATYIQELTKEGLLKPLAMISSAHQFSYSNNWNPPQAFVDAFIRDYPQVQIIVGKKGGIQRVEPSHGYGMLWVDKSGDGIMQAGEIEFSTAAENLAGSGWSHDFHDLTLRVPGLVGGKKVLVTLKPEGWWPGGAPKYPPLNDAVRAGIPIDLPSSNQIETTVDRFGNTIMNCNPMMSFSPEGKQLWTYPNKWIGVHGSHDAPLPNTGELQGVLFFSGVVPLDEKSDVMLMNGNHGRAFVMTSDGLYLDEMFPDVRLMNNPQAGGIGILGGECFGGVFGKSEKDGNYYFQGGGIQYRIYRIDGLRETKRGEGSVEVSPAQVLAAERARGKMVEKVAEAKTATVPWMAQAPVIDGKDGDWKGIGETKWESSTKFPVSVKMAYDSGMLYLFYTVKDESPWLNQGKDWQALFKTGDGVDLQLGTNPEAKATRSEAVPGDLRLFIAPNAGGNVAVLYRHRVPGAKEGEGVVFQSPWRSEKVDVVKKVESAKIGVTKGDKEYRVEVAVPLAELGLTLVAGKKISGDLGVIYGDAEGNVNVYRNYWSNKATGLVNDVPGEIMLTPRFWGDLIFEEKKE